MKTKSLQEERQEAIVDLIKKERITDQKHLVMLLKDRHGIATNQAVVSRDLRHLGVVKKQVKGALVYEMPTIDVATEILRLAIVDIAHNEAMIVIKTHPGLAAFVGDYLDQLTDVDSLGCLAGENVVFITPRSIKAIQAIYLDLCQKLYYKKGGTKYV